MPAMRRAAIVWLGAMTTGLCVAAPAGADPGFDPCHSGVPFICRLVPMAPELDHDVDLTQNPDGLAGGPAPADQPGQPGADLGGG